MHIVLTRKQGHAANDLNGHIRQVLRQCPPQARKVVFRIGKYLELFVNVHQVPRQLVFGHFAIEKGTPE